MDKVIVGLGSTGLSVVKYFSDRQIAVSVVDSRAAPPNLSTCQALYPTVPIYTGGFPKSILEKATTVIVSPGIRKERPDLTSALQAGVEVIGDIELFAREVRAPVVAITGSNGKSTVTTLVGAMAKQASIETGVGGNIGTPALSLLERVDREGGVARAERVDRARQDYALYVLELSSFQLETTYSLKPVAAAILNVSADHLDRYASFEDYCAAKRRIYNHCEHIVFNRNEAKLVEDITSGIPAVSFGLDAPSKNHYGIIHEQEPWLAKGNTRLLPISSLKLFCQHNIANVLAALALGECASIPMDAMLSTVETFTGLPHRCEWVREYDDVLWINDSKGTNVGATLAALQGLAASIQGKWVLIAGGAGKQADFTPLTLVVSQHCSAVVLIGEAAEELERLLGTAIPCARAIDLQEAVVIAKRYVKPGDGVLLSPACSSLDMFANFEERGNIFKALVWDLGPL